MTSPAKESHPLLAKLVSLLIVILVFAGAEGLARLLTTRSHLDNILEVLQEDAVLFWKQRPGLDTKFEGKSVRTDERGFRIGQGMKGTVTDNQEPDMLRVVCMGASPTFGWGVEYEEAYPARLQKLLKAEKGIEAEVINAGEIGYSSHQGKILLEKEVAGLWPDLITVCYEINDIDRYRFFRSDGRPDSALEPQSAFAVGFRSLLSRSRFIGVFQRTLRNVLGKETTFEGKPVEIYRPQSARVPEKDYRDNLAKIVDFARSHDINVILVRFPVNLPLPGAVSAEDAERARGAATLGVELAQSGKWGEAVRPLEEAVALDPYLSEAHYFLGVCRMRLGQKEPAARAFSDTMKSEAYRCGRDGQAYNRILSELAAEKGVPTADAADAFKRHGEMGGGDLFLSAAHDPIHPNAAGHEIIARVLLKTMAEGGVFN